MKTEQEEFWRGGFGNEYIDRNKSDALLAANISFFSKLFSSAGKINSVLEFGCNVGMNLKAIRTLLPEAQLTGIEINKKAVDELSAWKGVDQVIEGSIFDIDLATKFDLTLIKGVLIHVNPKRLDDVYSKLYNFSDKYICIVEYYNPSPVTIPYRGHDNRLFKRDFAGEFMEKFTDLELVDYGFLYHKDPAFPQDDLNWFLIKKTK
jgi:spore coat polysaccharide biosynthesis protein SpsF